MAEIQKSKEERIAELLESKDLLDKIVKAVHLKGMKGEDQPIKSVILVCIGKLTKNKEPYSTNAQIEDESNIGKDHMISRIRKIVFFKSWISYNAPSPTAITYSQRLRKIIDGETKEEKWITEGTPITEDCIVYIIDADNKFLNSEDCKMLMSEEEVNTDRTTEGHSIHLKWKKPVVIITSAQTSKEEQLLTRPITITLTSTKEQTKDIIDFNLERRCSVGFKGKNGMIISDEDANLIENVKQCFYLLEKVYVDLQAVSELIEEKMPKCISVKMRRLASRLYDLIAFSATLHQRSRDCIGIKMEGENEYKIINANQQDVTIGFEAFNYAYKDEFSDVTLINKRQKNILRKLKKEAPKEFSASQIQAWNEAEGMSYNQLKYTDIPRIMREDANVKIDESKRPTTFYYEKRLEVKPVNVSFDKT